VFRHVAAIVLVCAATAASVAAQGSEPGPEVASAPTPSALPSGPSTSSSAASLLDPMRPFEPPVGENGPGTAPAPRFRLTAVLISAGRRVAIINGKPYQEGQKVGGAELTYVEAKSVGLREGDREIVVHLGQTRARPKVTPGDSAQ
jgi:hypothetical protein